MDRMGHTANEGLAWISVTLVWCCLVCFNLVLFRFAWIDFVWSNLVRFGLACLLAGLTSLGLLSLSLIRFPPNLRPPGVNLSTSPPTKLYPYLHSTDTPCSHSSGQTTSCTGEVCAACGRPSPAASSGEGEPGAGARTLDRTPRTCSQYCRLYCML